jgi:chromosomal replication initiation ATPase DnaA
MGWESNLMSGGPDGASSEARSSLLATIVSAAFSVRPGDLCGPNRGARSVALARQVAMYLTHTQLGLSYTATGALFGRDRTTAAHACRIIEEKREEAEIDAIVDCVERAIDQVPGLARRNGESA